MSSQGTFFIPCVAEYRNVMAQVKYNVLIHDIIQPVLTYSMRIILRMGESLLRAGPKLCSFAILRFCRAQRVGPLRRGIITTSPQR